MREHLIGYLLGALEPEELDLVSSHLERDPELQAELHLLKQSLAPLAADEGDFEPPPGLARRTCGLVERQTRVESLSASGGWRLHEYLVAASVLLTASFLFFPALQKSRANSRLTLCQNNLRLIGAALQQYGEFYGDYLPPISGHGEYSTAGIYAPILYELGYLSQPRQVICPAAAGEYGDDFSIPTLAELRAQDSPELVHRVRSRMGGSYAFALGYVEQGNYRPHRNRHRGRFVILADAPDPLGTGQAGLHGCCGQNVLFEDLHVEFLNSCQTVQDDHIFRNDYGLVGAGIGPSDMVVGSSSAMPVVYQTISN